MTSVYDCPGCGNGNTAGNLVGESRAYGDEFEAYDMACGECGAEWMLYHEGDDWTVEGDRDYEEV